MLSSSLSTCTPCGGLCRTRRPETCEHQLCCAEEPLQTSSWQPADPTTRGRRHDGASPRTVGHDGAWSPKARLQIRRHLRWLHSSCRLGRLPRVQGAAQRAAPVLDEPPVRAGRVEDVPAGELGDHVLRLEVVQAHHAGLLRGLALPDRQGRVLRHPDGLGPVHAVDLVEDPVVWGVLRVVLDVADVVPPQGPVHYAEDRGHAEEKPRGGRLLGAVVVAGHEEEHDGVPDQEDAREAREGRRGAGPRAPGVHGPHPLDDRRDVLVLDAVVGAGQAGRPEELYAGDEEGHHQHVHEQPRRRQRRAHQADREAQDHALDGALHDVELQPSQQQGLGLPAHQVEERVRRRRRRHRCARAVPRALDKLAGELA
mmetsp:Transcript_24814/g.65570  ORF Transcript_24814/g.65570 Transcript_24814/m.65570 type:complete len:369 (+) Transcript_24814:39-1145(+)